MRLPARLPVEFPARFSAWFPASLRNALVAGLCAITVSGCTTISYFWQAFAGQMEVRRLSRPVEEVLADSATGADLKRRLKYATRARDFASQELALPDNRSYRQYADLQRPFVVWNVFVAPELSLDLKTFCFPVAGDVASGVPREVFGMVSSELAQHAGRRPMRNHVFGLHHDLVFLAGVCRPDGSAPLVAPGR